MSILSEIRNDMTGAAILADWLGNGEPVHPLVAEARAQRCTRANGGTLCPHNVQPKWWERAKEKAAEWIRAELEAKHNLSLTVPQEEDLGMCDLCGCCTRLKIWTPLPHITAHVHKDQLAQAPSYCWMRVEIEARKEN